MQEEEELSLNEKQGEDWKGYGFENPTTINDNNQDVTIIDSNKQNSDKLELSRRSSASKSILVQMQ
jgi:hypothetical protein